MTAPRSRAQIERARRRRRGSARAQRLAVAAVGGVVLVVVLLLTAFSSGGTQAVPVPAVPAAGPAGPPQAQVVATRGALRIQLPVQQSRVTAIGYHGAGTSALALDPVGPQGNPGLLRRVLRAIVGGGGGGPAWYALPGGTGPSTGALNVGATAGTEVYAPVDGTIVAVSDLIVDGRRYGARIDVRPSSTAGVVVSVSRVEPGEAVAVGAQVQSGVTPLGTVVDLSHVERLALARYSHDPGNHVDVEVHPAPGGKPAVGA